MARWRAEPPYRRRKLDPYKIDIVRWLDSHPLSAAQIFLRLLEQGYDGGYSILTDYVRQIPPPRPPAYLTLDFALDGGAQVNSGRYGTLAVGATPRRLSFFMMGLSYNRLMYLKFTRSQTLEQFLSSHENVLRAFGGGGASRGVMVDNLKAPWGEPKPK